MNNRITQEHVDALLDASEIQTHTFHDKEVVASFKLPNGFTVIGRGACVDKANFDFQIGMQVAREQVSNQVWMLEGYLLQQRLYEQGVLSP